MSSYLSNIFSKTKNIFIPEKQVPVLDPDLERNKNFDQLFLSIEELLENIKKLQKINIENFDKNTENINSSYIDHTIKLFSKTINDYKILDYNQLKNDTILELKDRLEIYYKNFKFIIDLFGFFPNIIPETVIKKYSMNKYVQYIKIKWYISEVLKFPEIENLEQNKKKLFIENLTEELKKKVDNTYTIPNSLDKEKFLTDFIKEKWNFIEITNLIGIDLYFYLYYLKDYMITIFYNLGTQQNIDIRKKILEEQNNYIKQEKKILGNIIPTKLQYNGQNMRMEDFKNLCSLYLSDKKIQIVFVDTNIKKQFFSEYLNYEKTTNDYFVKIKNEYESNEKHIYASFFKVE